MKKYLFTFRVCEREFSEPRVNSYTKTFDCFQDAYAFALDHLKWLWGTNDSAEILCIRQEKGE